MIISKNLFNGFVCIYTWKYKYVFKYLNHLRKKEEAVKIFK